MALKIAGVERIIRSTPAVFRIQFALLKFSLWELAFRKRKIIGVYKNGNISGIINVGMCFAALNCNK